MAPGPSASARHILICLPIRSSLNAVELSVLTFLRHQLLVRADFDELCAVEDDDQVGHPHRRETVRDKQRDTAIGRACWFVSRCCGVALKKSVLGFGIECR